MTLTLDEFKKNCSTERVFAKAGENVIIKKMELGSGNAGFYGDIDIALIMVY